MVAERFIPHDYQRYCIDRIVQDTAVGLFLEPGLGKTAISLFAVLELKYYRFAVRRCLVIAPKKVAETTWVKEQAKWEQLSPLRIVQVLGSRQQRVSALEQTADVYVINRENVQWLVDYYQHHWPFDMVIIDESSNFKNPRAKRFRALKMVRPKINRIVELTGTPRPRSALDLWAQVFLLDGGKRLGRTITSYRDIYFTPGRRNRNIVFEYIPRPGAEDEILKAISDICISMRESDYLELPPLMFENISVKLDKKALTEYTRFERDMLLHIDDETVLTANTAAVLSNKLLQLCNGAMYDEEHNVVELHDCKIQALLEFIEQLGNEHAIICYNFKHDLDRLLNALSSLPLKTAVYRGADEEIAWNNGEIDLLLVQPMSCGYGLNLQNGGHHVVWFGLTFDAEVYQQMNKRLHRQGQAKPVFIHNLVVEGCRDEDAVKSVEGKTKAQNYCLDSLKARIADIKNEVD